MHHEQIKRKYRKKLDNNNDQNNRFIPTNYEYKNSTNKLKRISSFKRKFCLNASFNRTIRSFQINPSCPPSIIICEWTVFPFYFFFLNVHTIDALPTEAEKKSESRAGIAGHANFRLSSVSPAGNNFPASYGPPGPLLDPDLRFPRTFTATMKTRPVDFSPDARTLVFRARDPPSHVIDQSPAAALSRALHSFNQ